MNNDENLKDCREVNFTEEILDLNNLEKAVRECVDNDDIVGLMEVIMIYAKTREMIRELFLRT
jgi:hypothetical protein